MDLLLHQSYFAACISPLIAILLTVLLWSAQDHSILLMWVSFVIATGMMRLVLFLRYRRAIPPENRVPTWERTFFVLTMLYFLSWGVGGIWIMPTDSPVHQVVILYFLIGLAGSAVAVFSANRPLLLGAITALLLPMIIWLVSKADPLSIGLGIAGAAFLISAVSSSRILSSAMRQNLRLNQQLVKARAAAEQLARVDELTGLYNRRAFYEYGGTAGHAESARCNAYVRHYHGPGFFQADQR